MEFVRLRNEYNPVKLNKFKSKSKMELEIEKDLHSYKQRVYKDFFYWLGGTWYIVAIVFTIYGIIHTLDIRAFYFIVAYLVMGFIGRAYYQRFNLRKIYIHDNKVTLEFKKYNKDVVHTCNLKKFSLTDYPRGSMVISYNEVCYIQNNDYYWRINDIRLLLTTYMKYKEKTVRYRKFTGYS